jgi:acyl dehydratase
MQEEEEWSHMTIEGYTLATINEFIGRELGVSDWITVEQERIDQFAHCTGDNQWIHVDAERARRESPFGTTIAHGYLTLSLLPAMQSSLGTTPAGVTAALNYGTDKVRFATPVKAGARIRDRITLLGAEDRGNGRVLVTSRHTVEIEGEVKPALVADTLALLLA